MKHIIARTLSLLTASAFLFGSLLVSSANADGKPLPEGTASPIKEIRATLDDVLKVVEAHPGKAQDAIRREKLREVINPRFDFREMSQRSLGANWQAGTPEQQKQFVDTFSDLLAKTYLAKIELIKKDTVTIEKEDVDFPKALVKTTIFYNEDKFPLDYKLINRGGTWKVYDVVVENIGLVANYRNEFAGIIRKDGFDGLLKQLAEKNSKK